MAGKGTRHTTMGNLTFYLSRSHSDWVVAEEQAREVRRFYNTLNKLRHEKDNLRVNTQANTPVANSIGVQLSGTTESWRKPVLVFLNSSLHSKLAQSTRMKLDEAWSSVIASRSKGRSASIPGYKKRYAQVRYNPQTLSRAPRNNHRVLPTGWKTGFNLPEWLDMDMVQSAELIPTPYGFELHVLYIKDVLPVSGLDASKMASIDFGLNNLATVVTTVPGERPKIISGLPIKSLNRWANKTNSSINWYVAKKKVSEEKASKDRRQMWYMRNRKVNHYLQVASSELVRYLVNLGIGELVIGWSPGFKIRTRLGKRGNQNFVQLPIASFRDMVTRKAEEVGIKVTIQEESYTSKASFIDGDPMPVYGNRVAPVFSGKRITRGVYQSKNGTLIHADVNAAWNILRKCKPSIGWSSGVVVTPERLRLTV